MVSKLKKNILTISISLIFVFFIGYGIETFYNNPSYEDICYYSNEFKEVNSSKECNEINGTWETFPKNSEIEKKGYCNFYKKCQNKYDESKEKYNKNIFIITFLVGLFAIILGSYYIKLESVGSGIMGGGTLTIIYGTLRYWSDLNDMMKFIILGIVLFVLIWIGYKKIKE